MKESTSRGLINSRLLVLQSKRLLLSSAQRRLDDTGMDSMRQRVDTLRHEADMAQHVYRSTVLAVGSPENLDYWIVAYSKLIEMGNTLATKLRSAVVDLPLSERYQASADVEMLEEIVNRWQESMRHEMAKSVA